MVLGKVCCLMVLALLSDSDNTSVSVGLKPRDEEEQRCLTALRLFVEEESAAAGDDGRQLSLMSVGSRTMSWLAARDYLEHSLSPTCRYSDALLLLTSLADAHKQLAGTASPELMALLQRATEMRPVDWRNVTDDEGRMRLLFGSSMNGCLADLIAGLWMAPGGDAARDIEQKARLRLVKSVLMGVRLRRGLHRLVDASFSAFEAQSGGPGDRVALALALSELPGRVKQDGDATCTAVLRGDLANKLSYLMAEKGWKEGEREAAYHKAMESLHRWGLLQTAGVVGEEWLVEVEEQLSHGRGLDTERAA